MRPQRQTRLLAPLAAALLAVVVQGCSRKPADASAATPGQSGPGGAGARGGRTIVLAASDVGTVKRQSIADGVPITGNLAPIETVVVRARLDGNLEGVFAREGDRVSAGQLLARFESTEQQGNTASAEADRAAAQAELSTAKWSLDQTQELFRAGALPERDFRVAQQSYAASRARLAATEARLRTAGLGSRDTRVVSPVNGIVDKRLVQGGERVTRGAEMFTVVRNSTLELQAAVPERRAGTVRAGQRVTFSSNGRVLEGRVARVSPTVDAASRSVTVYVQVPNADGAIRGGSFATGTVISRTIPDALVVPMSALHQSPNGERSYVYRVNSGRVEQVDVGTGVTDERAGVAEITGGLSDGDRIVTGNVGTLGKGTTVQIIGGDRPGRS